MLRKDKQYSVQLLVLTFFRNLLQFGGFFSGASIFSVKEADCHDITEILKNVALQTVNRVKSNNNGSLINEKMFNN